MASAAAWSASFSRICFFASCRGSIPVTFRGLNEASLDARVLLVAIGASLLTSLIAGLLPACRHRACELTEFLKSQSTRGSAGGHSRMQSALIVVQTAMVVVLLAAAGLLIRSYIKVETVDTGFSQSTVTFHLTLDGHYKPQQSSRFLSKLDAEAGGASRSPGSRRGQRAAAQQFREHRHDHGGWVPEQRFSAVRRASGYAGLLRGDEHSADRGTLLQRVRTPGRNVIINQTFAKTYFPNRNPIGGRISGDPKVKKHWATVVGVVADVRHMSLEEEPQPQMYNAGFDVEDARIAVRSTIPPASVVNEIRSTLRAIDPNLAVTDIHTMGDWVSIASARRRFQTSLLTAFAAIALVLALVGLYGLMAFSVNRRTREVGIRMALGAERRDVLLLMLRNASRWLVSGLVAGLVCTWIVTRAEVVSVSG